MEAVSPVKKNPKGKVSLFIIHILTVLTGISNYLTYYTYFIHHDVLYP